MRLMFFASSSRHTRCALVTGVQTCALPISDARHGITLEPRHEDMPDLAVTDAAGRAAVDDQPDPDPGAHGHIGESSEERRVGTESVSTCTARWSPDN